MESNTLFQVPISQTGTPGSQLRVQIMSHPGLRSHSYGPRRQLLSLSPILQIKEQAQVHMIQQNHCSILLLHRQGRAQASPAPQHLRLAEPFACDPLYSKGFSYDTEAGYDYLSLEQHRWMLRDSPALSLQKRQPWNTEPRLISNPCSPNPHLYPLHPPAFLRCRTRRLEAFAHG